LNIITKFLDLLPAGFPLEFTSTDSTGLKTDPSVATVRVFEEDGGTGAFDNNELTGSPFTLTKINGKTGNYGVKIAKSLFTAGKYYRCLFEATVDSIDTSSEITYFMINSSSFKADVTNLDTLVSSRSTPADISTAHATTDGKLDNATYGLAALKALIDNIDTSSELAARFDEIKGAGWTDETLKAIKEVVDAINLENFTGSAK
jgi:hypothetical protein